MTAKEFIKEFSPNDEVGIRHDLKHLNKHVEDLMIRFAKMHVEKALKKLAKEYNVSESCITHILNNTSWKEISIK